MKKNDRQPNPFITPLMIFISGIIPAFCLGFPGFLLLAALCAYFYEKESTVPNYTAQIRKREAQQEADAIDHNQVLLNKAFDFEDGAKPDLNYLKSWPTYHRKTMYPGLYERNTLVFPQEFDGLYDPDPYVNYVNNNRKETLLKANIIQAFNDKRKPYSDLEQEFIHAEYDLKEMPEYLKQQYFVWDIGDDSSNREYMKKIKLQRVWENQIWLFAYGLFDGKNLSSVSNRTASHMMNPDEDRIIYNQAQQHHVVYDEVLYKRILKSWQEGTLPPLYQSQLNGAAAAYLDYQFGILREDEDHNLHFLIKYCFEEPIGKHVCWVDDTYYFQEFNVLPMYKITG